MVEQDCYKEKIRRILNNDIIKTYDAFDNFYINTSPKNILKIISILSSDSELAFSSLADCFAADFLKIRKTFSIYYQLISYKLKSSIFITTDIKENETAQSLSSLFENADWFEREIFDMFGIRFDNCPEMSRLLNPPDFSGFPLRKDYKPS